MQKELSNARKRIATSISMKTQIMNKTESGYNFFYTERKFGLVNENRLIKTSVVNDFLQIIQGGKYDDTQSIVTIEASELFEKYNITDLEGNALTKDNVKDYLIVLDGQHRISAFSKLNYVKNEAEKILVPNVHIKKELNDIREYLADINMIGKSWSQADKVCVAAIGTENKILSKINELIKDGYSVSTASLILIGKRLSSKELNKILQSGDVNGLPSEDEAIARAEKFLTISMSIEGMETRILRKRFYIKGFNHFATSRNDAEAFGALSLLTIEDFNGIREDREFIECLKNAYDKLERTI